MERGAPFFIAFLTLQAFFACLVLLHMALQLRINSPNDGRPSFKGKSRILLRCSEPPESPLSKGNICDALELDSRPCKTLLPDDGHTWCRRHVKELNDLNSRWSKAHKEAEVIHVYNTDTAKQKVIKLRLAVDLRRQIREHFYPRGGDTTDFIKWVMILEKDVRALADSVLMTSLNQGPTPETPGVTTPHPDMGAEKIMILQSPMDPRIPIDSLRGMPDDGAIVILKHFYTDLCKEAIRRLYSIAPDLNDSRRSDSPIKAQNLHDTGTDLVRAWFRIMILNDSDAEALEHATRSRSIHDFLSRCHASQLETYCDFFEKAWRPHAVQYLRAAICAQTLAGGDIKTVALLGGMIPSTTEGLKMTKACWDMLYRWFPTLLTPWTLASICSNFEDYTTICKLLMLGLYHDHWFDSYNILNDCTIGVYLGFIPSRKGDFYQEIGTRQEGELFVQRESRSYLCGHMAIGDPLTSAFLDELRKRTERLLLVVYEGTNADATVHPSDEDLFISRYRATEKLEQLEHADWTTDITLEDVKNDLRLRKTSMYDPIVVDSWQFIIIDKQAGLSFQLFDIVHDVLLMLVGDPSPRVIAKRVIREVIPPSVQEIYLNQLNINCSPEIRFPAPPEVFYEGNRQRCYNPDRGILIEHQQKAASENQHRDTNRFIRRVIEDMERCGIISLSTEYEEPQTRPVVIQGADGALDLYFPYDFGTLSPVPELTPSLTLPPSDCLTEFAKAFKQKNPSAIMAKGSILTHYCAWPMPSVKRLGKSRLNFGTWEGHIYHWNAMPFDRPWSERAWQFYVHHYINSKFPFVMVYLTTFVICGVSKEGAERASAKVLNVTEDEGWRVVLPRVSDWKSDVESLGLGKLFSGVQPM